MTNYATTKRAELLPTIVVSVLQWKKYKKKRLPCTASIYVLKYREYTTI